MVDEPLDGKRVALLVRQFPGVNGALILLEGGAVLGGQLPHWLNLEAALQAPEALAHFIRFIVQLEAGQAPQSKLVRDRTPPEGVQKCQKTQPFRLCIHSLPSLPENIALFPRTKRSTTLLHYHILFFSSVAIEFSHGLEPFHNTTPDQVNRTFPKH